MLVVCLQRMFYLESSFCHLLLSYKFLLVLAEFVEVMMLKSSLFLVVWWVGQRGGCIIVDSTRKGKRFPDSMSKTIPIWTCVLNRAIKNHQIRMHGAGIQVHGVSDYSIFFTTRLSIMVCYSLVLSLYLICIWLLMVNKWVASLHKDGA